MTYGLKPGDPRAANVENAVDIASSVIIGVLGFGYVASEIDRVILLNADFMSCLYLGLLVSVGLLIAGWVIVAKRESKFLTDWLDPEDRSLEFNETYNAIAFAAVLLTLLYGAKHLRFFAVVYLLYSFGNLVGWIHIRGELKYAIGSSKKKLDKESGESAERRQMYANAINSIETYYLKKKHVLRASIQVGCAAAALVFAFLGARRSVSLLSEWSYVVLIFTIILLEGLVIMLWRRPMYSDLKKQSTALYWLKNP